MSQVPDAPRPTEDGPPREAPPAKRKRRRLLWASLLVPVLALIVAVIAVTTLGRTEWATQRLFSAISNAGVRVLEPHGTLMGDFSAKRIEIDLPRGGLLRLDDPAWQGLRLVTDVEVSWRLGIRAKALQASKVHLNWVAADPDKEPQEELSSLALPLSVHVGRVQVGEFSSNLLGAVPVRELDAGVALHAGFIGPRHKVDIQSLKWGEWQLAGDASIGVRGRMPVDATLHASGLVSTDLKAEGDVQLNGDLKDLGVKAQAQLQRGEQAAQAVDIDAQVQAFAPWPVSRLKAKLDRLNLADLQTGLPRTLLHGTLDVSPDNQLTSHTDVKVEVDLRNDLPGAWDHERLPVRAWRGELKVAKAIEARSVDDLLSALQLDWQLDVPRARGNEVARVKLKGGWGEGRSLQMDVAQLEPQALHTLAPALQLQGSISLKPDSREPGSPASWRETAATMVASLKGQYGAAHATPERARTMPSGERPVEAKLDGRYAPGLISITNLALTSGEAQAVLSEAQWRWPHVPAAPTSETGSSSPTASSASLPAPTSAASAAAAAQKPPAPAWQARGQLNIKAFDPQLWMPWPKEAQGRNQIFANAQFELDAGWRGELKARIDPSWLAGVPMKGNAQWESPRNRQLMALDVNLEAAGNRAQATAQLPWTMDGAGGLPQFGAAAQWQAEVDAGALQALQPVVNVLGAKQIEGVVHVSTKGQGLWPRVSSEGRGSVTGLQWLPKVGEGVAVASVQADWAVDLRTPTSGVQAQVNVRQARAGSVELVDAQLNLNGSVQAHKGELRAHVKREPVADAASASTSTAQRKASQPERLAMQLAMNGGLKWTDVSHTWQGNIQDLVVHFGEAPGREVVRLQPTPVLWRQDANAESIQVGPTHLNLMGATLNLRHAGWTWTDRLQDPVGVANLDVALEAFNLPQLLDRWQPEAGWGGDLILQGDVKVRHSRNTPWVVDALVERKSGDISLSEPTIEGNSAQRLGIREARVVLQSRDGVWTLSELFEGRSLGKVEGRQVVRAADPMAGPQGTDPLSGNLDLSIDSLRPWGTWIPAGWRVSGKAHAKATLSGTLGAPRYGGEVVGDNLGVGQSLLGVNLTDGKLRMSLQGDVIVLQHFEARGGTAGGLITAQGQATFGEVAQARLNLKADHFPALQRVDRRVVVSGDINATLGEELIEATGRILVDEGLIDISQSEAPTVGDDVTVVNRPANARPLNEEDEDEGAAQGEARPQRQLSAQVDVDLGKKLRIKGMGMEALLTGGLQLTTPANKPAIRGAIRVENGTFAAYGQKLVVDRGIVAFTGPMENPRLDILAMRPQSPAASNSDVKVGVAITGTAQDPRIRLYSEPGMSETEKLSWLVLGRAPTGLGGADIGLLQTAAVALLSGEGASPTDNLIGILGLDEFSVRQTDGAVRETVVNVGKQVSRQWYVGYERNLNATGGNWQLIYTLARRFTLRMQAGVDNAADVIWSWRWD